MVDELIFDTQSRKVLYIIVDLDDNEKRMITAATESQIRNTFTGLAAAVASGALTYDSHPDGFYDHKHFDDTRFYGSRAASSDQRIPGIEDDIERTKKEARTGGGEDETNAGN